MGNSPLREFLTDDGPTCPHCQSTCITYTVETLQWTSGKNTVQAECVGCERVRYFQVFAEKVESARELSQLDRKQQEAEKARLEANLSEHAPKLLALVKRVAEQCPGTELGADASYLVKKVYEGS